MSVVAFFSAKGAPGVTTAAMLAASLWPRPVLLADCDPGGGDVGLRLPAPDGRPLTPDRGLLSLLPVARRALAPAALLDHTQQVLGGGEVLVGVSGPEQTNAGGPVWDAIATAFTRAPERDVVVDVGRLDARSPVLPLVTGADIALCVVGSSLSSAYLTRARLRTLVPALGGALGPKLALLVRAESDAEARDTAAPIIEEFPETVVLGHLRHDPAGAGIFEGRPVNRPERTLLVRSGRTVLDALFAELTDRHAVTPSDAAPTEVVADGDAPTRSRSEERRARSERSGRRFRGVGRREALDRGEAR